MVRQKKKQQYFITPYLRRRLKKPLGRLFLPNELKTERFLSVIATAPLLVTVGDRVTDTLQELGRTPDVQVVDMLERRVPREAPSIPYKTLVEVRNPAGVITAEAMEGVQRAIKEMERPVRVLVKGEEDLLAIPAVEAAPMGSLVFYGQPGVGVVVVVVDERAKSSVARIMRLLNV